MLCDECGEQMEIGDGGVAYHLGNTPDGIDHKADADHVALNSDVLS